MHNPGYCLEFPISPIIRGGMNLKIQHRHLKVTEALKRLIDRHANQLEKILPAFTSRDLDLHINLERLPRGRQYHTVLVMTMPQRQIRVERMENNPATSVLRAFDELLRRIKKFKSQLNRESFWKKEPVSASTEPRTYKTRILESAINQNLDKIENYIRRELLHRTLTEDIPVGLLQARALVDEVFLEVNSRVMDRPETLPLDQWMLQISRRELNSRFLKFKAAREEVHVEEIADAPLPWDDEELTFYQPDEVAMILDKSPREIVQDVEQARLELRKRLGS